VKSAIIIGATGLIGSFITKKLLADTRYEKVKIFVRRTSGIQHSKLTEYIVDFDKIWEWQNLLTGDELYSALGTTIKKAGSKENQRKIDFDYQYEVAKAASENGVKKYFLVSSLGANYKSGNFYLRIKGLLDEKIMQLEFDKIRIFRPSILAGERSEKRFGESFGIKLAGTVTNLIPALKKYRPINAELVAEAMIKSANQNVNDKVIIYESDKIFLI
jgi:uncharacterized protein YbjT (DUF2867 family)